MPASNTSDRRGFMRQGLGVASLGTAAAIWNSPQTASGNEGASSSERLPREVWIATVAQEGLHAKNHQQMAEQVLQRMQEILPMQPDIICLPELFPFANIDTRYQVGEVAEEGQGELLRRFAKFAADNHCYVVCPTYTRQADKCFNAAVFLDRNGETLGEYRKTYATTSEMDTGVCPGPTEPKVFQAEFGKIGAQICFDVQWDAGWNTLRDAGCEIVFWPSAFAGGAMLNARAWQGRYCVVSSTNKGVSKICDIDGSEVAATSLWHRWVCAPINLEKAFLHTWPYVQRFGDIVQTYGSRVRIKTHAEEEWSIIESRDPQLKIAEVMERFDLLSIDEHLRKAERQQDQLRKS